MPEKLTLELKLTVTYVTNGVSKEDLTSYLDRMVSIGVGNGLLTEESPAEVETFNHTITQKE